MSRRLQASGSGRDKNGTRESAHPSQNGRPGLLYSRLREGPVTSSCCVDDKFAVDHDDTLAELRKVTAKPITYVINTHTNGDVVVYFPAARRWPRVTSS